MTVHVTVVFPNEKVAGALFVTVATAQLSEVIGVPKVTPVATHEAFAFTVKAAGAVMEGRILSITVTVAVQVEVTLMLSVIV